MSHSLPAFRCYQVGGSVRDALLGLAIQDRDWVVVGAQPETLLALGYTRVGADFPVFLHPITGEEYALARTERKTGPGYRGFSVVSHGTITLEEDLKRRDLTINAMALDPQGHLIDPFGGAQDLHHRVLRHVSAAFAEDPLRVLRVARFLARLAPLGFAIAPETLTLMRQLAHAGVLRELTPERVWTETLKALNTPSPALYFQTLSQCDALPELFGELAALKGQSQPVAFHPEGDAWHHTLLTLEAAAQLTPQPEVRFAALLHDLGKGKTPAHHLPHHHGHESRGVHGVQTLCRRLKTPKSFENLATLTARHHMHCHRLKEMSPHRVVKLLTQLNGFRNPPIVAQFVLACTADKWGRGPDHDGKPYPAGALLATILENLLAIDTRPLIEAGYQGEAFGQALHRLRIQRTQEIMTSQSG